MQRVSRLIVRGLSRAATIPFQPLPEGRAKAVVRRAVLSVQNSLAAELAINRGETVVQVGTPNPRTVRRYAQAVGPAGRLIIVEAVPANQERIASVIDELPNASLIRAAASSRSGTAVINLSDRPGDNRLDIAGIEMDNSETGETIEVEAVRLDDALPALGVRSVDFLSVTVNGAEAEVLWGSKAILENGRPWSRVYAKGHALNNGIPIHVEAEAFMRSLGYRTKISRGEPSPTGGKRAGDLFAWREP